MKRPSLLRQLLALLTGFVVVSPAPAQTSADPNEGFRVSYDSQFGCDDFSWWGRAGRTYFIQESSDLFSWTYAPMIDSGGEDVLIWSFDHVAARSFRRLRYSDIPTDNPFYADFDGDKVGNYFELVNGTDPLVSLDTDNDGLPDDWEKWYLGNLDSGANNDADGDGLLNLEEFLQSTNPNSTDSDYDGLSDGDEVHIHHTDPLLWDSDGDNMPDGWEVQHGLNPLANDSAGDSDMDGLTNIQEYWQGTDPQLMDTDGDGLTDGDEVFVYQTDPARADSDGDGLNDMEEIILGTDPWNYDTDQDGLPDGDEVNLYATNPLLSDTDGDGMPDKWELDNQLNPLVSDIALDPDNDGLTNLEEFQQLTDPQDPDTDGDDLTDGNEVHVRLTDPLNFDSDFDGLPDGWELQYGMNPLVANNPNADPDGDGLTNAQEATYGTNPTAADSDGDGTNDGDEAAQGSNPKNAADGGQPPPPDTLVTLKLWLGAEQTAEGEPGSYHEDDFQAYRMKIYEKNSNGTDQATPLYDYASNGTFVNGPTEFKFEKTKSYTVKIYTATNTPTGQPNKDFDYTALIKGCVVTDDPNSILGDHEQDQEQGKPFPQRGKKATLTIPKVEFKERTTSSGFDRYTNPNWLMVPENGSNDAKVEITPSSVANKINLVIRPDSSQEIVTPGTATTSPQAVTVNGTEVGEASWVEARCEGQTEACARFNIAVKKYQLKTVDIHSITQSADDVQAIPSGKGQPDQMCITPGANGTLDTISVGGDDTVGGGGIKTGPNGICESTAGGDDVQVIPVGKGKPNVICVTKGANNHLDTAPTGDDVLNGDSINTGPDGICNTTAHTANIAPQTAPSASDLQQYLNQVFGLQTNTYFYVYTQNYTVNYDLNHDGILQIATPPSGDEVSLIRGGARNSTFDFNVYFVYDLDYPGDPATTGAAFPQIQNMDTVLQDHSSVNSEKMVTAHEIGHLFQLNHPPANDPGMPGRLMNHYVSGTVLLKSEWDTMNNRTNNP